MQYRDPFETPDHFMEDIQNYVSTHSVTFLLPISEATTYIILAHRHLLPNHCILPFPDSSDFEILADKNQLFHLAQDLNLPFPESVWCKDREDGRLAVDSIRSFPAVLKPSRSRIVLPDRIITTHVVIAHTREAVEAALSRHDFFSYPFTIQSFVKGEGQGIFALYREGKAICFFAHRRLREKPPEGGVSVLSESTRVSPRMQSIAKSILDHAHWNGVAMVEFRVAKDGTPYLMEVNPRFWGSLQLAIDSGTDFPYLLYQSHCMEDQLIPPTYHKQRLRWLLGDIDRLYLVMKAPLSKYSLSSKFMNLVAFFIPHAGTRHEVNRFGDMAPFWFELKRYFKTLLKR
ncbi:ATP-grasp domain-containing protein [Marinobacter pelagius]|nr:ATP-grasp domain-containing protein [Marinobacter sp. C7]